MRGLVAALALALSLALPGVAAATGNATDLRISGNRFLDEDGDPFRLLGVNLSSAEFTCVEPTYENAQTPADRRLGAAHR